jgi:ribosome-binding factor A
VETSRDLRNAHVYFSFLNPEIDEEKIIATVIRRRKEIRYRLGSRLGIKYVPQLRFHLDLAAKRTARINEIISELGSRGSLP